MVRSGWAVRVNIRPARPDMGLATLDVHPHKRIYDPTSSGDGYRLLVMRRWSCGIRKDSVDAWQKGLTSSEPLRKAYLYEDLAWDKFDRAYLDEMTLSSDVLLSREILLKEVRRARIHRDIAVLMP